MYLRQLTRLLLWTYSVRARLKPLKRMKGLYPRAKAPGLCALTRKAAAEVFAAAITEQQG